MEYTGKVINIGDVQTVGQNWLQKRTVVLEEATDKDYKGGIAFDLIKDKTKLIDWYKVWDVVTVSLNFKTNYYEVKDTYYNSITAWKISWETKNSTDVGIEDIMPFN